jgi:DNA-binding transcriptional MerR regulator
MASEELIMSTIKRMIDSGIDDSTIASTLRDIGLNDAEISRYLSQAKGTPAQQSKQSAGVAASSSAASQMAQEMLHTATHNKLDEHSEKLDSMHKDVSGLHEKIDTIMQGPGSSQIVEQLSLLNQRVSTLERQIADLKAMSSASKTVLDKILETSRSIVEKL